MLNRLQDAANCKYLIAIKHPSRRIYRGGKKKSSAEPADVNKYLNYHQNRVKRHVNMTAKQIPDFLVLFELIIEKRRTLHCNQLGSSAFKSTEERESNQSFAAPNQNLSVDEAS